MPIFRRLTSAPALAAMLVLLTLLATGPLRAMDHALHDFWSIQLTPELTDFLDRVPNAIAGQAVCLPVLAVVTASLAWRHRTWHPVVIAAAAEASFFVGVGGLKLVLSRTSPKGGDRVGRFFDGGVLEQGWYGISYPSGHAAEAILIYGAAAYLLRSYAHPDTRARGRLFVIVTAILVNSLSVAYYLGFHWPTDLLAGVLAGGLFLRVIVDLDRRFHTQRRDRQRDTDQPARATGPHSDRGSIPVPTQDVPRSTSPARLRGPQTGS